MQKEKKKRKGSTFLLIVFTAVFAIAGYKLATLLLEYKAAQDEYAHLREYTSEMELVDRDFEDQIKCPIEVDFDELKAINPDIVGWLYIGSLDISYPIVKGEDNDYYLHRTFEKKYNFAGSIFMEEKNSSDFSDPNTIIYGHNMQDGSMFGMLKHLVTEEEKLNDPHFWILTPKANYYYDMFSIQQVPVTSEAYTLFYGTTDEKFLEYTKKMYDASMVDLARPDFTFGSKVVTLSTCTSSGADRFIVQGVRAAEVAR